MPVSKLRKNHKQALLKRNRSKVEVMNKKMKFYQNAFGKSAKTESTIKHVDMEFPEGDPLMGEEAVTSILNEIRELGSSVLETDSDKVNIQEI